MPKTTSRAQLRRQGTVKAYRKSKQQPFDFNFPEPLKETETHTPITEHGLSIPPEVQAKRLKGPTMRQMQERMSRLDVEPEIREPYRDPYLYETTDPNFPGSNRTPFRALRRVTGTAVPATESNSPRQRAYSFYNNAHHQTNALGQEYSGRPQESTPYAYHADRLVNTMHRPFSRTRLPREVPRTMDENRIYEKRNDFKLPRDPHEDETVDISELPESFGRKTKKFMRFLRK